MKKNPARLIAISTLALKAACSPAWGQVLLNCTRVFDVGQHVACGNGSLTISPDGSTSLAGCLITNMAPQPGRCLLSTGGVAPTRNVQVKFTSNVMTIKAGAAMATVNFLKMLPVGETAPHAQYTFTPTEVKAGVTIDIGGRLNFSDGQAIGNYTGTISITANLL